MTDDQRLELLVRAALRPMPASRPTRDLWPRVLRRSQAPAVWDWIDLVAAAAAALALLLFPDWLWLLAYHL